MRIGIRTGTVSRTLKLSTVSTVTIDDGSWFHCMIVREKRVFIGVFACLNKFVTVWVRLSGSGI